MNQQPFLMPFPMLVPQQAPPPQSDQVPRRVAVAMSLWQQVSQQLTPQIAVNDVGFERMEPRKLEVEEQEMVLTACKLLTCYMQGGFKLTKDEEKQAKRAEQGRVTVIRCPNCMGQRQFKGQPCDLCEGGGSLTTRPTDTGE